MPLASGGRLSFYTRWQTISVERSGRFAPVARELAAAVMCLSGTDFPQVVEVAEIAALLPVVSQLVLVERIKDRVARQMVDCTSHEVAIGETDLQGNDTEVVATGE